VLLSTGGAAIKWSAFTGWQLAGLRSTIAAGVLVALLPEAKRGWSWRTLLVGCASAATTLLYVQSNKYTTAANAIFLVSTSPVFIIVLAPLLLRERVSRRDWVYMTLMMAGMSLCFAGTTAYTPRRRTLLGNILAAACAVTWAFTVMGYRWVVKHGEHVGTAATSGNLIAGVVALPLALPLEIGGPRDWIAVVYLGTVQLGLAYVIFARAIPHLAALEVALLLLIVPVLNPVWAWLVHGETPRKLALLGGVIILAATGCAR
jgi:drug/metabolite transporter (DMT)-like permease